MLLTRFTSFQSFHKALFKTFLELLCNSFHKLFTESFRELFPARSHFPSRFQLSASHFEPLVTPQVIPRVISESRVIPQVIPRVISESRVIPKVILRIFRNPELSRKSFRETFRESYRDTLHDSLRETFRETSRDRQSPTTDCVIYSASFGSPNSRTERKLVNGLRKSFHSYALMSISESSQKSSIPYRVYSISKSQLFLSKLFLFSIHSHQTYKKQQLSRNAGYHYNIMLETHWFWSCIFLSICLVATFSCTKASLASLQKNEKAFRCHALHQLTKQTSNIVYNYHN